MDTKTLQNANGHSRIPDMRPSINQQLFRHLIARHFESPVLRDRPHHISTISDDSRLGGQREGSIDGRLAKKVHPYPKVKACATGTTSHSTIVFNPKLLPVPMIFLICST